MKKLVLSLISCIIAVSLQAQTTYTWDGSSSTSFTDTANWSPSGVPGNVDHIRINATTTRRPILSATDTVANITITTDTLDLGSYALRVTGTTTLTGGVITNGTINFVNSTTTIGGTRFDATVNITANTIGLGSSTFSNPVTIAKNGSSSDTWNGSNTFSSTFDFYATAGTTYFTGNSNSTYNGNITIANTGSGTIGLANGTGISTLASTKTISIGSNGFTNGTLFLRGLTQTGSAVQNLTLTGTATLQIGSSTFNGKLNASAPLSNFGTSTFNDTVTVTKTSSTTASWGGNNTFGSTFDLSVTSGGIDLGFTTGNTFNGDVKFSNTGSGTIRMASSGTSNLATSRTITVGSFAAGTLNLNNLIQAGSTAQNITLTGTATLQISGSTFNGNLTASAPLSNFGTSTFNGTVTLTKSSSTGALWGGNNVFGSLFDLTVTNGGIDLGFTSGNTFNGDVKFSNTGSGSIRLSATSSAPNTLASGKTISVGTAGFSSGSLTLSGLTQSGSTAQSLTFGGSTATLTLSGSTFNGVLTLSAPNVLVSGTAFGSTLTVTKSSSSTNTWSGANTYNGDVSITNTGSGFINLSSVASGGDVYNGNATFTKSGSGDVILAGTSSTVTFKGNVTLSGISSTQFVSGNSALFNGTAAQTLTSTTALSFGNVTINKASNDLTLSTALNITGGLTLTSGKIITTSTNMLNFADNATVSGAKNSSHVQGPVAKTGNDAFTYPTGKAGVYRPIGISAPASSATVFTAEYINAAQTAGSTADTSIANLSDDEYWTLNRTGSSSNVNVTLSWNSTSRSGAVASNMRVVGWNGSQWTNYGNATSSGHMNGGVVASNATPTAYNIFALGNRVCTATATITPSGATSFCNGGSVALHANANNKYYAWSTIATSQVINATTSGTYTVNVRDTSGCNNSASQVVTVWAKPIVNAGSDTVIVAGDTIQLNASATSGATPYNYAWSPSTGLSATNVVSPNANPSTTTDYIVTVTDNNGCINKDTVKVWVGNLSFTLSTDTAYAGEGVLYTNTSTGFPSGQQFALFYGDNCFGATAYNDSCFYLHEAGDTNTIRYYLRGTNIYPKLYLAFERGGEIELGPHIGGNIGEVGVHIPGSNYPPTTACNLVSNPSFDTNVGFTGAANTLVPTGRGQINRAYPWVPRYSISPTDSATPDLFSPLINDTMFCTNNFRSVSVPNNFAGFQQPFNSTDPNSGYIGLFTLGLTNSFLPISGSGLYREYAQQQLLNALEADIPYFVSFKTSRADKFNRATRIQAVLSNNDLSTFQNGYMLLGVPTTDMITSNGVITDTSGWTEVSGIINGAGQSYITIGRFNEIPVTAGDIVGVGFSTLPGPCDINAGRDPGAFYYIDDVKIIPIHVTIDTQLVACRRLLTPSISCAGELPPFSGFQNIRWTGTGTIYPNNTSEQIEVDLNIGSYLFEADIVMNGDTLAVFGDIDFPLYLPNAPTIQASASEFICGYQNSGHLSAIITNPPNGYTVTWSAIDTTGVEIYSPNTLNTDVIITQPTDFIVTISYCDVEVSDIVHMNYAPCCEGDINYTVECLAWETRFCLPAITFDTIINGQHVHDTIVDGFYAWQGGLTYNSALIPNQIDGSCNGIMPINGVYDVMFNTTFKDICIQMGKNARIIIHPGDTLRLDNAHIYACGDMWDYIAILPGGRLETFNNTLIEDGKRAVYTGKLGEYYIQHTYFNKDFIGIHSYENSTGVIESSSFLCYDTGSLNSTWVDTTLTAPFTGERTFTGIINQGLFIKPQMLVGGSDSLSGNYFDNLYNGILSLGADLTLKYNRFKNIQYPDWQISGPDPMWLDSMGVNIFPLNTMGHAVFIDNYVTWAEANLVVKEPNWFDNCHNGIYIYKNTTADINYSDFRNCFAGIITQNTATIGNVITITDNTFAYNALGILSYKNNGANLFIGLNTIQADSVDNSFWSLPLGIGIAAYEPLPSTNSYFTIRNNIITDAQVGITAYNLSSGSGFNVSPRALIENNTISVDINDVLDPNTPAAGINAVNVTSWGPIRYNLIKGPGLDDDWRTGIYYRGVNNLIQCNQTDSLGSGIRNDGGVAYSLIFRNKMSYNDRGYYAHNDGPKDIGLPGGAGDNEWDNNGTDVYNDFDAQNNGYYIWAQSISAPYYPTVLASTSGWEYNRDGATPTTTLFSCDYSIGARDAIILNGLDGMSAYILAGPDTVNDYPNEDYWNKQFEAYRLMAGNDTIYNLADSTLQALFAQCDTGNIGKLYRALNVFSQPSTTELKAQQHADTLSTLIPATNSESTLIAVLSLELNKKANPIYKTVNLAPLAKEIYDADSSAIAFTPPTDIDLSYTRGEVGLLDSLANLCPYSHGMLGVFMARAGLAYKQQTWTSYCESTPQLRMAHSSEPEKLNINIYPNPTTGNLYVALPNDLVKVKIQVISSAGAIMQTQTAPSGLYELNLNDYANGLYFIRIFDNTGKPLETIKVSLQR